MPSPNYIANGNFLPCRFVQMDPTTDHKVIACTTNGVACGISPEYGREPPIPAVSTMFAASAGDGIQVYGEGETCLLEIGGTVGIGAYLKSADANGLGTTILTTGTTVQNAGALALEAGVSGDKIRVQVMLRPKMFMP